MYRGIVRLIILYMTNARQGAITRNISVSFTEMVKAMIMAPITMNGERSISLSSIFTPDCAVFISAVMRVTSVLLPILSISA